MSSENTSNLSDLFHSIGGGGGGTYADKRLPDLAPVPSIPPRVGAAKQTKQSSSTGGGIASPLIETTYASRTYHAEKLLTSTDGVFAMSWKPIDEVHFIDSNGAAVTLKYKAPD